MKSVRFSQDVRDSLMKGVDELQFDRGLGEKYTKPRKRDSKGRFVKRKL